MQDNFRFVEIIMWQYYTVIYTVIYNYTVIIQKYIHYIHRMKGETGEDVCVCGWGGGGEKVGKEKEEGVRFDKTRFFSQLKSWLIFKVFGFFQ